MYPIEKYRYVTYDRKNEDGTVSKVILAMSTYCGKIVKGIAKCIATDDFDIEKGKKLAAARCDYKVCLKRKNRAFKKKHEVAAKIEELTATYVKMSKYYDDALNECFVSASRLNDIEEDLK